MKTQYTFVAKEIRFGKAMLLVHWETEEGKVLRDYGEIHLKEGDTLTLNGFETEPKETIEIENSKGQSLIDGERDD